MTSSYVNEKRTTYEYIALVMWRLIGQPLFNIIPLPFFQLRVLLLRLFGAEIGKNNRLYPSLKIWLPKNLRMGSSIGIGEEVYLYNKSVIEIGDGCVISRSVFLCTASHDYNSQYFELWSKPISLQPFVWIAAHAIVMPGVTIAEGSVVGAGSILTKSTESWWVYAGNPAIPIKKRNSF